MRSLGTRSPSMRSLSSASERNWASTSIREVWVNQGDAIQKSGREEDEEELRWATIERLPTYDRLRKGMLKQVLDSGSIRYEEVDVANLVVQCKKQLIGSILKVADEDNEIFLRRVRDKTDRVGIDSPKIEFRFEHLSVEGDANAGTRALPTLVNVSMNKLENDSASRTSRIRQNSIAAGTFREEN